METKSVLLGVVVFFVAIPCSTFAGMMAIIQESA
jgi:hypothetical protein